MLSVVIPAFNEEARILATLRALEHYLAGRTFASEIIVVDDGSRDRTSAIAGEHGATAQVPVRVLRNEDNHGKGYAVRQGVLSAGGELILYCDADASTPPHEIERAIAPLVDGTHDVVIGSRRLAQRQSQPALRRLLGRQFRAVQRRIVGLDYEDTQCGFKVMRRDAARALFTQQRLDGFAFDVEILMLARDQGWRTLELPVAWVHSGGSRMSPIRAGMSMLRDLMRLRLGRRRG